MSFWETYTKYRKGVIYMATFILSTLFTLAVCFESFSFAIYEIKINKNKPGGFVLILLSFFGLVFPIIMYLKV